MGAIQELIEIAEDLGDVMGTGTAFIKALVVNLPLIMVGAGLYTATKFARDIVE